MVFNATKMTVLNFFPQFTFTNFKSLNIWAIFSMFLPSLRKSNSMGRFLRVSSASQTNLNSGKSLAKQLTKN
jgi:hypothetical protein